MKGSALVDPNAVPAIVGDRGVLLVGGADGTEGCETPERRSGGTPVSYYNARTHAISRASGDVRLSGFEVTSLTDGRVMVAGGFEPKDRFQAPTRRTRIWNPRTGRWTEAAPMGVGRASFGLVTLADGRVLAAGGWIACSGDEDCMSDSLAAELYDPATNHWTRTADVALRIPDDGSEDQFESLTALAGGQALATGGNFSAALFDPSLGTWAALDWHGGWVGPIALRDGSALTFGSQSFGAEADVEVPFAAKSDGAGRTTIVAHWWPPDSASPAVLPDGRVLFVGGVVADAEGSLGQFLASADVFSLDSGQLGAVASMPAVRGASRAVVLEDGSVLVVGGVDVSETQPATEDEDGNDTPGCVPVKFRVLRWVP